MQKIILACLLFSASALPLYASTYGTDFLGGCGTWTVDSTLGSQTGDKAFDGNTATYWSNNNTEPGWIKCDLGSATHTADKVRVMGSNNPDNATIKDWQLLGSQNDSTYDVIATGTASNLINQLTFQEWEFATTSQRSAYRYYKFQIDNDYRPGDNYKQVVEWQLQTCIADCGNFGTSTIATTSMTEVVLTQISYLLDAFLILLVAGFTIWFLKK